MSARFCLKILVVSLLLLPLTGCELQREGSEGTSTASAIPWNKPASWEGPGALGAVGFQGTH